MKKLLSVKKLTAFILVLTMAMLLPVQTVASATVGKYVSELYVAYGKDADAAKKTLSDKGYTPVDLSADNNDSDNRGLLRYDLIQSPDGKGDLNAYDGKQWNALYSSQNTQASEAMTGLTKDSTSLTPESMFTFTATIITLNPKRSSPEAISLKPPSLVI